MREHEQMTDVRSIVAQMRCGNKQFETDQIVPGMFRLRVHEKVYNQETSQWELYSGRWWLLETYVTPDEVARTCLLACITFAEHEVREMFTWTRKAVFNPHQEVKRE